MVQCLGACAAFTEDLGVIPSVTVAQTAGNSSSNLYDLHWY